MSFDPRLPLSTQAKISGFLERRYPGREAYLRAVEELRLSLVKLAANPRQGISSPGPFETRPLHRFSLFADGVRQDVQVCFCYDAEDSREATITITDFMAVEA